MALRDRPAPPKPRELGEALHVRLTTAQRAGVALMAEAEGVALGSIVRRAVDGLLETQPPVEGTGTRNLRESLERLPLTSVSTDALEDDAR